MVRGESSAVSNHRLDAARRQTFRRRPPLSRLVPHPDKTGRRQGTAMMQRFKTWTLTDVHGDVWLDSFATGSDTLHLPTPFDWSLRKRTLRGGLRDGLDLIEVHNGALSFSVLPTRGMGLWRGDYRGNPLGWRAPIVGPVHPKYVQLTDRGGLGWLTGFDELLCRCGLASNGPPGDDDGTPLTLH